MIEFLKSLDFSAIVAIITSLTSLGLFAAFRGLVKDIKAVIAKYQEIKKDGTITEAEALEFTETTIPVIERMIKIGYLLKRVISRPKK